MSIELPSHQHTIVGSLLPGRLGARSKFLKTRSLGVTNEKKQKQKGQKFFFRLDFPNILVPTFESRTTISATMARKRNLQKELVLEYRSSWKDANDAVIATRKKLGDKATPDQIFAGASSSMLRNQPTTTTPSSAGGSRVPMNIQVPAVTKPAIKEPSSSTIAPKKAPKITKSTKEEQKDDLPTEGGWLSRSKSFHKLTDWAFGLVDQDGSGEVDEKELYSGLLLIHLKLGTMAGPAACKPVTREQVSRVFKKRDADGSGSLDKEEFREVMSVLCGNVFARVAAQWSLTLIVVPLIAKKMVDGIIWLWIFFWTQMDNLDKADALEDTLMTAYNGASEYVMKKTPVVVLKVFNELGNLLELIPSSVWETLPVTLMTCILGVLVVPYTIMQVDDFFHRLADKKKEVS